MDEQEQERAQQAIAARLQEEWDSSKAHERLERPPQWRWPLTGRQTANLIAVVLALIVLSPVAIIGIRYADAASANDAANSFCTALGNADYNKAYNLLSQRVRDDMTLDEVRSALQAANIGYCAPLGRQRDVRGYSTYVRYGNFGITGDTAQFPFDYLVNGVGQVAGIMTLHHESDGWRVDGLQATDGSFTFFSTTS